MTLEKCAAPRQSSGRMSQFRWATQGICGQWLMSRHAAMLHAVNCCQATASERRGHKITLKNFARIQKWPEPGLR